MLKKAYVEITNRCNLACSFCPKTKREPRTMSAQERGTQFCYGLRDQLGVLADGTAVPCCLDHEGDIALGNLFTQPLSEILQSERACALREGFSRRCPSEELCRRCGFAARF